MRNPLIIVSLLALTACATPRESCVSQVTRDLDVINALIAESTLSLQRGYGVDVRQEVRTMTHLCPDWGPNGEVDWDFCERVYVRDIDVPIAIDLEAERVKLRQLEQQRDRLIRPTEAAVQQCLATYPE